MAADLLATTTEKLKRLVKHMEEKYPDRENVGRLVRGFNLKEFMKRYQQVNILRTVRIKERNWRSV